MTAVELLGKFKRFADTLSPNLPDRSALNMGDLRVGDLRWAVYGWSEEMPENEARYRIGIFVGDFGIPERARDWSWGTSGLKYGDFLEAAWITSHE